MAHFGQRRQSVLPLTDNGTAGHSHPLRSSVSGLPVRGVGPSVGLFSLSLTGSVVMETNMWAEGRQAQRFEVDLGSCLQTHSSGEPASSFHCNYGGWRQNGTTKSWSGVNLDFGDVSGAWESDEFYAPVEDDPLTKLTLATARFSVTVRCGNGGGGPGYNNVVPLNSTRPEDVLRALCVDIMFYRYGSYYSSSSSYAWIPRKEIGITFLCLGVPSNAAKPVLWRPPSFPTVIPYSPPSSGSGFEYAYVTMSGDRGITQPQNVEQWPDLQLPGDLNGGRVAGRRTGYVEPEPGSQDDSYKRMTVSNLALSLTRLPDS